MHVPALTNETELPVRVQTPALPAERLKATPRPELDDATIVYAGSPTSAAAGGVELKLTAWGTSVTGNDCCAWGAER